mgnify:CR=1 FL=1
MAENQLINDMQFDVLREIGNIGSGNAATALAASTGSSALALLPRGFLVKNAKVLAFIERAVWTIASKPSEAER